jgi:zinc transporter, ZIP family
MTEFIPFLLAPSVIILIAAVVANWLAPGPKVTSNLQHLAAGIIFATIATEVVPELLGGGQIGAVSIGYGLGMCLIVGVRYFATKNKSESKKEQGSWVGLAVGGAVDLLIDGFLMGVAFSISKESGILLTIAIAFEVLFLGFTFSVSFAGKGLQKTSVFFLLCFMSFLLFTGGVGGYLLLGSLPELWKVSAMAFGAVALLYLVSEELLVEAHEKEETTIGPFLLFIGFGAMLLAAMVV